MEYTIYCDESISKGRFYSDFYGGCLVRSIDQIPIIDALNQRKQELNLFGEIKWTKVTSNYLEKYIEVMKLFFQFVREDKVKVRIMFRQSAKIPQIMHNENRHKGFHLLYYQFIKHAFGLRYHQTSDKNKPVFLRLYFDRLPDSKEENELFLNYIYGIQSIYDFKDANLKIRRQDIAEVNSHDHVLLQCSDIILGAMAFRLNDFHKEIPEGQKIRGKKTIAKEKLYKFILSEIRSIYNNFNIGITTGSSETRSRWEDSYRHWSFSPRDFKTDEGKYKRKIPPNTNNLSGGT